MRELNARLRVKGLPDEEAAALPTRLDADTLDRMEISTWRTDAGDFDVLTDIPAGDGHRLRYDELGSRAMVQDVNGVAVHVAALEDVIASKEWASRPKDRQALPELREIASRRRDDLGLRADGPGGAEPAAGVSPPSPPRSSGPDGP